MREHLAKLLLHHLRDWSEVPLRREDHESDCDNNYGDLHVSFGETESDHSYLGVDKDD